MSGSAVLEEWNAEEVLILRIFLKFLVVEVYIITRSGYFFTLQFSSKLSQNSESRNIFD